MLAKPVLVPDRTRPRVPWLLGIARIYNYNDSHRNHNDSVLYAYLITQCHIEGNAGEIRSRCGNVLKYEAGHRVGLSQHWHKLLNIASELNDSICRIIVV